MKTLLLSAGLAVAASNGSADPGLPFLDGTFAFYVENDTFSPAGDEAYTQGLELQVGLHKKRQPIRFMGRFMDWLAGERRYDSQTSVLVGQTMFTPQNIVTYEPRLDDRPFVAHLYLGLAWSRTEPVFSIDDHFGAGPKKEHRPRQWAARLLLGVTGPVASGRTAQGAFHVLREGRIPKGWSSQKGNRFPELTAMLMRQDGFRMPGIRFERANITTLGRLTAGTVQNVGAAAVTLRIGDHLTAFPPTSIPERVGGDGERTHTEWAIFGAVEGRAYALNRLVDQGGGHPELKALQWEWHAGAYARLRSGFGMSYTLIWRDRELHPIVPGVRRSHWVGALQLSKSAGAERKGCDPLGQILAGTRVQIGLGRGRSRTEDSVPAIPSLSLSAHWGAERSIIHDRFAIGVETTGTVREHGPHTATPDGHRDTFLLAKTVTLGMELLPQRWQHHRLQLRVGGGRATVQTQTIPVEGTIDQPAIPMPLRDTGKSVVGGLRYLARLGRRMSLGTNFAYSDLSLDEPTTGVRRARYWITTLTVQIHPWGRDRKDAPKEQAGPNDLDPTHD